jgi:hypothetical protein
MTTHKEKIIDAITGEVVIKDYTPEQTAELELLLLIQEKNKADAEAKSAHKIALLDKLGITAEEAKLLLS